VVHHDGACHQVIGERIEHSWVAAQRREGIKQVGNELWIFAVSIVAVAPPIRDVSYFIWISYFINQAIVRELLDCDPLSGALTWRYHDRKWFTSDRSWNIFNAKLAGKPAIVILTPVVIDRDVSSTAITLRIVLSGCG
jgi:hypothetical protein